MNDELKVSGIDEFIKLVEKKSPMPNSPPIGRALLEIYQVHSAINRGCGCRRKFREGHAESVFVDVMKQLNPRDKRDIVFLLLLGEESRVLVITSKEGEELIRHPR